ncbi:MAG: hypothetical protein AAFV51_05085 [Pseudomonadota bacterium]
MNERLKAIWGGFEQRTSRELSGRGVDNIVVEHRRREDAASPAPDAPDLAPAKAAMAELRTRLAAVEAERRASRKKRRREDEAAFADPTDLEDLEAEFSEDDPTAALRAGLAATDQRIRRREASYVEHRTQYAAGELRKKRKKFLGMF